MRDGDGVGIAIFVAVVCSLLVELASCAIRRVNPVPICADCMTTRSSLTPALRGARQERVV
jgi:hypothetical protein